MATKPKPKPKSKPKAKDPVVRDPFADRAAADVSVKYGGALRTGRDQLRQDQAHQPHIDRIFDAYKSEHDRMLEASRIHAAGIMQGQFQGQADAQAAVGTGQAAAAARDQAVDGSGQAPNQAVAQRAAATAGGAETSAKIANTGLASSLLNNDAAMQRVGQIIGSGLRAQLHDSQAGRIAKDQSDLTQLGSEAGGYGVQRYGELQQQGTENELASRTLLASKSNAKLDYDAAIARIKSSGDIAGLRAELQRQGFDVQRDIAAGHDKTSAANTTARNNQSDINSRRAAAARLNQSLGKNDNPRVAVGGAIVTLTDADVRRVRSTARTFDSIAGDAGGLATHLGKDEVIKRIKASHGVHGDVAEAAWAYGVHHKLGSRGMKILADYFKAQGHVPDKYRGKK